MLVLLVVITRAEIVLWWLFCCFFLVVFRPLLSSRGLGITHCPLHVHKENVNLVPRFPISKSTMNDESKESKESKHWLAGCLLACLRAYVFTANTSPPISMHVLRPQPNLFPQPKNTPTKLRRRRRRRRRRRTRSSSSSETLNPARPGLPRPSLACTLFWSAVLSMPDIRKMMPPGSSFF